MSATANAIVAALMLLFASMYLGTGWSLVFFSFPLAQKLTPETYSLPLVEPVKNATKFFTYMTIAMFVAGVALIVGEAGSAYIWVPIVYLIAVSAATALTMLVLFPYNREMTAGIATKERLDIVLAKWKHLNLLRVSLWTTQWLAVTLYFVLKAV